MIYAIIILVSVIFILLVLGRKIACCSHSVLNSIFSSLLNVLVLIALNIYTNLNLPVNYLSLGLAAVTGFPGISTMIILNNIN